LTKGLIPIGQLYVNISNLMLQFLVLENITEKRREKTQIFKRNSYRV